jgi:GDP-L-fucose synthase
MELTAKIFVAGHKGMVGSAICRKLSKAGYSNIITRTSAELNLRDQLAVINFFNEVKPEYVFLAAAKVGGIFANNTYKADFIYDNIIIQSNVIHEAYRNKVKKLLFLGSSCIYPKLAPQPMKEEYLLTGALEPTNEPYAIAKIAGIKMCQAYHEQYGCNFISVMPTNLYGPNDNYNLANSHVLPALLRKFHEAALNNTPSVTVWGDGTPKREFLYVDDLAEACLFLINNYESSEIINIGTGEDISIRELTLLIKEISGFKGEIIFDTKMPNGTPRKLLDVSKLKALGFSPKTGLKEGIRKTFEDFVGNHDKYKVDKKVH